MVQLDGDHKLLTDDKGNVAKRDIVQFVEFADAIAKGSLAEEVLMEIPEQVSSYCSQIGFKAER